MRNLKSFLLEEIRINEAIEKEDIPKGFKEIEMRGRITNQLQELLKDKNIDLNLKSNKASKALKAIDDPEKIFKDLKIDSTKDFVKLFRAFAGSPEMKGVFTGVSESTKVGNKSAVKIQLSPGFETVAGARNSTLKFIKFWCTSTAVAAGISINIAAEYKYLEKESGNILIVVEDI